MSKHLKKIKKLINPLPRKTRHKIIKRVKKLIAAEQINLSVIVSEDMDRWDSSKSTEEQKFITHPIKIFVQTPRDKEQLLLAFEYLHNNPLIDTELMAVNYIVHLYTHPELIEVAEKKFVDTVPQTLSINVNPIDDNRIFGGGLIVNKDSIGYKELMEAAKGADNPENWISTNGMSDAEFLDLCFGKNKND